METNTLINLPKVQSVLGEWGAAIAESYKAGLIDKNKNASSELYKTVRHEVIVGESSYEVVLHLQDYWKYIEYGRKPGKQPPMDAILRWVEIKPIIPRPMENGKLPTDKQLSFLIARSIGEHGIEPTPLLSDAVHDKFDDYYQKLSQALAEDTQRIVNYEILMSFSY